MALWLRQVLAIGLASVMIAAGRVCPCPGKPDASQPVAPTETKCTKGCRKKPAPAPAEQAAERPIKQTKHSCPNPGGPCETCKPTVSLDRPEAASKAPAPAVSLDLAPVADLLPAPAALPAEPVSAEERIPIPRLSDLFHAHILLTL